MYQSTTYLLGVKRCFELTCVRQITAMLTKSINAQGALKSLLAYHSHLPISTTLLLFKSFIRSAMTYSGGQFGELFLKRRCKLQILQKYLLLECVQRQRLSGTSSLMPISLLSLPQMLFKNLHKICPVIESDTKQKVSTHQNFKSR